MAYPGQLFDLDREEQNEYAQAQTRVILDRMRNEPAYSKLVFEKLFNTVEPGYVYPREAS